MGWCSVEETRILVDVTDDVMLMCELFVGQEYVGSYKTDAYPGIPVVYVLYNLPPSVPCRLVWNSEIEVLFTVSKRVRLPMELNDDFPLVQYVRCNVGVYSAVVYGLGQTQTIHEKVAFVNGNHRSGMGSWDNLLRERPNIIIHTGCHVNLSVVQRLSANRTIAMRNAWRRIRDLYRDSWTVGPVRSLMATISNIFSVNVKPFSNHHLLRMQRDELYQLVRSACGMGMYSGSLAVEYSDIVFITTMMYQEVLWRDIPHYYDGAYKHFMAGGKTLFLLDAMFHRGSETFLGHNQLAAIDNTLALSQRGSNVLLAVSANPFVKRRSKEEWSSKKRWIDDFTRVLQNAEHHRLTWVCGVDGLNGQEVLYHHRGMIVRGYLLPSVRGNDESLNRSSIGKVSARRPRKHIGQFKCVHTESCQGKSGYLITEYEPIKLVVEKL